MRKLKSLFITVAAVLFSAGTSLAGQAVNFNPFAGFSQDEFTQAVFQLSNPGSYTIAKQVAGSPVGPIPVIGTAVSNINMVLQDYNGQAQGIHPAAAGGNSTVIGGFFGANGGGHIWAITGPDPACIGYCLHNGTDPDDSWITGGSFALSDGSLSNYEQNSERYTDLFDVGDPNDPHLNGIGSLNYVFITTPYIGGNPYQSTLDPKFINRLKPIPPEFSSFQSTPSDSAVVSAIGTAGYSGSQAIQDTNNYVSLQLGGFLTRSQIHAGMHVGILDPGNTTHNEIGVQQLATNQITFGRINAVHKTVAFYNNFQPVGPNNGVGDFVKMSDIIEVSCTNMPSGCITLYGNGDPVYALTSASDTSQQPGCRPQVGIIVGHNYANNTLLVSPMYDIISAMQTNVDATGSYLAACSISGATTNAVLNYTSSYGDPTYALWNASQPFQGSFDTAQTWLDNLESTAWDQNNYNVTGTSIVPDPVNVISQVELNQPELSIQVNPGYDASAIISHIPNAGYTSRNGKSEYTVTVPGTFMGYLPIVFDTSQGTKASDPLNGIAMPLTSSN